MKWYLTAAAINALLFLVAGAKNFNFVPKTFMIPTEYSEFAAIHHRMRGAWIVKPVASSRGRGIFIVNHPNQVEKKFRKAHFKIFLYIYLKSGSAGRTNGGCQVH
jgi:glutathione synthase/RimK-type ligase-like ATP-grasp enzyme